MDPDPDGVAGIRGQAGMGLARELAATSIRGGGALPIALLPPPPHRERRQSADPKRSCAYPD